MFILDYRAAHLHNYNYFLHKGGSRDVKRSDKNCQLNYKKRQTLLSKIYTQKRFPLKTIVIHGISVLWPEPCLWHINCIGYSNQQLANNIS